MIQKQFLFVVFCVLGGSLLFMGCDNNSGVADSSGPPEIISVSPEDNADDVSVGTTVQAAFNQPMDESTINESTFTLKKDTVTLSGTITTTDTTAILSVDGNLEYNTTYSARLSSDITDANNRTLSSDYQWNFTTEEAPDDGDDEDGDDEGDEDNEDGDTTPPSLESLIPFDEAEDVSVDTEVTATFNEALNSSTVNTESFLLEQNGSEVEGSVSYSDNSAVFDPDESLAHNSTYTVTLTTEIEDEAGNALEEDIVTSFTTEEQEQDDGNQDDENNDNGEDSDTNPPSVTDVEPDNEATGVSIETTVSAEFSEEMDESTINGNTFILQQSGTRVVGDIAYSGNEATFTPDGDLSYNTSYTLTITTGAEDVAGNGLPETYITTFTTEEAPDNEPPSVTGTTPEDGATGVSVNTNVTADFSEAMDQSTLNQGNVTLQGPSGAVSGSVDGSGSSVTFTPDGELDNGTEYTFEIDTDAADQAGNTLQSPFTATFTTEEQEDTQPPEVLSSNIGDGDSGVAVDTDIDVEFSEPMDHNTLNQNSVTLEGPSGAVSGTVGGSGSSVTFTPDGELDNGTEYTFEITTDAADQAGNTLQNPFTVTFTTEEQEDTQPPQVTGIIPQDGATDVGVDLERVDITFNEQMDVSTIHENSILLEGDEGEVSGSVSEMDNPDNNFGFFPDEQLQYNTEYTITITGEASDQAGNSIQNAPVTANFTTEGEPDNDPPSVVSSSPSDGSVDVPTDTEVTATFSEEMDANTLNVNTVILEAPSGSVEGTITYSEESVTLSPSDELEQETEYTFALTTEVQDVAGNALQEEFNASFTTEENNDTGDEGPPGNGGNGSS